MQQKINKCVQTSPTHRIKKAICTYAYQATNISYGLLRGLSPPSSAPIIAKTNVSALLPTATSNLVSGPSAIRISVHNASLAQNEDVAVAVNDESQGNAGIVGSGNCAQENPVGVLLRVLEE